MWITGQRLSLIKDGKKDYLEQNFEEYIRDVSETGDDEQTPIRYAICIST